MAQPHTIRIPDAIWKAFCHLFEKGADGPLSEYKTVRDAAVGMFVWTDFHPQKHTLAPQIANLPRWADRTLIYNFIGFARLQDIELGPLLPKPAQATDLLALAKSCWLGDPTFEQFRRPQAPDNPPS